MVFERVAFKFFGKVFEAELKPRASRGGNAVEKAVGKGASRLGPGSIKDMRVGVVGSGRRRADSGKLGSAGNERGCGVVESQPRIFPGKKVFCNVLELWPPCVELSVELSHESVFFGVKLS